MSRCVLALDQGSHASRACLFDESGQLCASASVPVATTRRGAAEVEQDADELLHSLRSAAAQAVAAAQVQAPQLELTAAGLAVQRSTIVCCSRVDGHALAPALSWQDHRNAAWLQQLAPHAARIRELTGLPLSAHYGASKLRWCLDHLPAVARAAAAGTLLAAPLASYLALHLHGGDGCDARAARVDAANAARTLLFDSARLDWSPELLGLFALERAYLPEHAPTRGEWGSLSLAGQRVPLSALTGDQSAVPYAEGPADPATVYVNLGTGAFIQRPLRARPAAPAPLLGSVLCRDAAGAIYSLEGTVNGAGAAVSWFCARERCDEQALWPALETLDARTPLPVFVNGVGGLGSPWWRPTMESRFIDAAGGTASANAGAILQRFAAVIESIAFMIAANAALLEQQGGAPQRVFLAGGMSRSQWLCRRLASLLGVPVQVTAAEASARGVARLAAPVMAANWPGTATRCFQPEPDAALPARYQRFLDAVASAAAPAAAP
jgi:glycerol kinase